MSDVPADPHTDFAGRLEPDGAYDEVRFTGSDLVGADAGGARFLDCRVDGADLTEAHLKDTRWTDCRFDRVRGVGTELAGATLQDCELVEPRLGAIAAYGSSWRRVTVRGGKVDYLNLRGARLREVRFEDCVLLEPDFVDATLTDVTFEGSTLTGAQWSKATLSKVDLSRARLVAPLGLTSLRGATLSRPQLIELADAFADQLGIRIRD
ncbi:MAG TPA: pentapeptide repeat-containing protein [Lapillicoccus sp.]|nr:pentapeptide repeat-containing protein [Lapillicoccus sp.]